tara:strand:- start:86 stop:469 length:384 start_codon:yes stop_codon:yes gene_type:complete
MYQRKSRRFRRRSNGRGHMSRGDNNHQGRLRTNSYFDMPKNNLRPGLGAEKLFEKYTALAKEALSSGDKTLSENYLQHADHFMRIIEDKNKNQVQNRNNSNEKTQTENKQLNENNSVTKDSNTTNKE